MPPNATNQPKLTVELGLKSGFQLPDTLNDGHVHTSILLFQTLRRMGPAYEQYILA